MDHGGNHRESQRWMRAKRFGVKPSRVVVHWWCCVPALGLCLTAEATGARCQAHLWALARGPWPVDQR